jgi:hypothetical protein
MLHFGHDRKNHLRKFTTLILRLKCSQIRTPKQKNSLINKLSKMLIPLLICFFLAETFSISQMIYRPCCSNTLKMRLSGIWKRY